ncbi:SpoIVB peptidase [Acetonema longum]|uniref:Stage IV sporulation protein B n=1 Tax=Acetonema longum DSM 6540 TaxID=1009370 RepID=F7NJZ3_9FIRM|nr:SpoIVB peptidase [Acetonema longum]EGO63640.1 stage IV sporulation protein B [Acetonema longum DSM 6540]
MAIKRRSLIGIGMILLLVTFCFSPQFTSIYNIPPTLRIIEGETAIFTVSFPLTVAVPRDLEQVVQLKSNPRFSADGLLNSLSQPVTLEPMKRGTANVEFKLLGIIPLRTVEVNVLPSIKLSPGGQSIGVVLHSQGVLVVGISPVKTTSGLKVPAKETGILIGDSILSMNGVPVQNDSQVAEIIDKAGQKGEQVALLIKRGEQRLHFNITPQYCEDTKRHRIGLYVRDSAAGVGTLTFYEPSTYTYGALGHVITDNDTNQPIDCQQGKIVIATVSGIQLGRRGHPGEKIGMFIEEDQTIGNIEKNTAFGIFGQLVEPVSNNVYQNAIPVASMSQIQLGPAEMLTVVDGQTIEPFKIEIEKINLQEAPEAKGLVIKVTDERLLQKTGGIVQGMSGSPIIQDGKIVGAVTHVFVHDPTKGYGCFMDWMLMESGLIPKKTSHTARKLFSFSRCFI